MSSLDERLKLWIDQVPYIWAASIEKGIAMRYYHVKPDTMVYDENGKEYKMYILENMTRENNFDSISPIYLFKFGDDVSDNAKNLFKVYNPYFEKVNPKKLKEMNIRINGRQIDVNDAFVRNLYTKDKLEKGIYLRYLHDIPPITKKSVIFNKK